MNNQLIIGHSKAFLWVSVQKKGSLDVIDNTLFEYLMYVLLAAKRITVTCTVAAPVLFVATLRLQVVSNFKKI